MTRTLRAALLAVLLTAFAAPNAWATSRIKDLANIEGVRQNQLIGYGLVVGLNGTGDTLNNIPFTKQSLTAMLERLGVNIRGQTLRTGNVAAVMVTANLPPFGTQGTRIDITVSALGDSKSLQGGVLLVTPLLGADGNVYAVGQGSVAIGGFQAEGEAAKIVRGVPRGKKAALSRPEHFPAKWEPVRRRKCDQQKSLYDWPAACGTNFSATPFMQ
jgi:flagellar P-ring protein precursor FlgI